ncbi:MAG: hypothetical protein ACYSR6_01005 [Planctomycetota bacterium]|jgi:hypothetical protein
MNKEHVFPEWLIKRTGTAKTGIKWFSRSNVPATAATLPLCVDCNTTFGDELESPMKVVFDDLEEGRGISDLEAELFVRWLWKLEGLAWIAGHPNIRYTRSYTLRQRILRPFDRVRGGLILAVSLIDQIDESFGDRPMGVDSHTEINAIFVSGVFSKVAVLVSLSCFDYLIPDEFTKYRFAPQRDALSEAKLFYPKTNFRSCIDAIVVTKNCSDALSEAHDEFSLYMEWIHNSGDHAV